MLGPVDKRVPTRSVHDNFVLGYSVDCEKRTIVLRTAYRDQGEPFERTEVRFEGVVGYMLRDALDGVLFDIEEDSIERVLEEHAADFAWGARYGWPWPLAGNLDPRQHVASKGARVFRVQGQSCFDGFVIAQTMTIEAAEQAVCESNLRTTHV